MIFHWLMKVLRFLAWLVFPPPKELLARVNPNMRCPVCGWAKGRLRCVEMEVQGPAVNGVRKVQTYAQHTCRVCGARCYESPVANVNPNFVHPAIPRDEIEKLEDSQILLQPKAEVTAGVSR